MLTLAFYLVLLFAYILTMPNSSKLKKNYLVYEIVGNLPHNCLLLFALIFKVVLSLDSFLFIWVTQ
ncbi:hypothetical protein UH38_14015 [Aliterella atlantica CENA595]|uniref:Uncharacterized protein n=1 Tax=Aliterella atlantica CENA595 TaxID=1618023 RepID=A0A0D8ZS03_9CYAN|nr:hypothetical protein UH38_14015 [Aliterella atlantica CENA595]